MRACRIFFLICVTLVLTRTANAGGPCEKIKYENWRIGTIKTLKTCRMSSTAIDSKDFSITSDRDVTVEGFYAYNNKNLKHLPNNLGANFPNLLFLSAQSCSVKEISKNNFDGLGELRWLNLYGNQIETIDDDTFDGIPEVEEIRLDNNKIKKLNGRAIASLHKLTTVYLGGNECINEDFTTPERIADLHRVITEKCGFADNKACGVSKKATGTIFNGEHFERGDFPWMAALYRRSKQRRADYFCGGSVISDRHVLTAAHCLEDLVARDITVVFGAYDLEDHYEDERITKSPSRIYVHDHWNPHTVKFDADIAMLLTEQKIVFSGVVQPICLWESDDEPAALVGVIAGWGQSQNRSRDHETIPTMLELPIHINEDCFLNHYELAGVSSKRTFCAGSADGRGPCRGDSGGGFFLTRGDFPWMVALYRRSKQRRSEYLCGGSVISDRHVLTAAHCLEDLVARDISVVLGAYDLNDHYEVDRLVKAPSGIFRHDDWNPRTDQFDADIAMLLIPRKIVFSSFVQPICLWESDDEPAALVGVIAGRGQSQNLSRDHETIPTMLELPIHTNEDCFLRFKHLADASSKRTFCAGSADGRGPCRGDSGGGFYVSVGRVFYLRGIVSAAWDVDIYGECLLQMYTIYTNVLKFKPWIDSTMQSSLDE